MTTGRAIGVFDSGIGGLSVLKAMRKALPLHDFIYLADTAHAPYGERSDAYVTQRSVAAAAQLVNLGVQALVVACNTATAAAISQLRTTYPDLPLIGVEPALKPAAASSRTGRILVLATRSTLASARFSALLAQQPHGVKFLLQPCDGLARAIEDSALTGDAIQTIAMCRRYTCGNGNFGLVSGDIDTVVLGCTHYPLVQDQIATLLPPGVALVDNAEAVARQAARLVQHHAGTYPGRIRLLTTGQPQLLVSAARHWLNLHEPATTLFI